MKKQNKYNRAIQSYWMTEKNEVLPMEQSFTGRITQKMVDAMRWQSRKPDVTDYDSYYSFQKAMEEEMRQLRW